MTEDRGFFRQIGRHIDESRWPLVALLTVCVARLWLVPLPSSFRVDELVTAFVRHPGHASFVVAPQVPQSIYYWLPHAASAVAGQSEVAFRIPSMAAMGTALWLIGLLAARLIHPAAGWFAVFAALSIRGIDYFAIDARLWFGCRRRVFARRNQPDQRAGRLAAKLQTDCRSVPTWE